MKSYIATITECEDGKEEKVFEFYSNSRKVLYNLDKDAYEHGKHLLNEFLDYMNKHTVECRTTE